RNDGLLELAKLDFNLVQSLHREELKSLSIWWKDLALAKSLSFVRDRLVECYYWILGVFSEPHYSRARESRLFTDAIQRFAVDQLPNYMKDFYLVMIHNLEEMKDELTPEEKYRMLYLKEEIKILARVYFVESKWGVEGYVPTVEEHLDISGMGDEAKKEAFEWVMSYPTLLKASSIICRVMDDINSHELEQERGHTASTVECYMKQHGTDANEACKKLQVLVQDAWKDVNKGCLNPTAAVPMSLLERIVNFTRSMEDIHKNIDSYTHSNTTMKDRITLLLLQPVPV
ncbi:hypothetical protein B296_00052081, partial [Ensete ventricosum]